MILVCGSVAIDTTGHYPGSFAEYERRFGVHNLAVSLQLSAIETSFGGCGMNVTWGLNQLGVPVIALSVAGRDFESGYRAHLEAARIDTSFIRVDERYERSASAIILSDNEGHQLTAFHAGASVSPARPHPEEVTREHDIDYALLAPEDAPIMLRQARQLNDLSVPVAFDPGQGLAEFSRGDTLELIELSDYLFVNQHELEVLRAVTEQDLPRLRQSLKAMIVTNGSKGAQIIPSTGEEILIRAAPPRRIVDPTGCGDAFRAGFMAGLQSNYDLITSGRMGCVCATLNIEQSNTQNYRFTQEEFTSRYKAAYGVSHPFDH